MCLSELFYRAQEKECFAVNFVERKLQNVKHEGRNSRMDKVNELEGLWQERKRNLEWWTGQNGQMENTVGT